MSQADDIPGSSASKLYGKAFIKVMVTTRLFLKLQPPSLHPLFTLGWEVNARVAIFHQPNDRLLLSEYCICTIIIVHTATTVNALMSSLIYTRMYPSKVQSVRQECQVATGVMFSAILPGHRVQQWRKIL